MSFNKTLVVTCDYCKQGKFYSPTAKDTSSVNILAAAEGWSYFRAIVGSTTLHICPACNNTEVTDKVGR